MTDVPADEPTGQPDQDSGTTADEEVWHSLLKFLASEPGSQMQEIAPGRYLVSKNLPLPGYHPE